MDLVKKLTALEDVCVLCSARRVGKWALVFSPPTRKGRVQKLHLCPKCYKSLFVKQVGARVTSENIDPVIKYSGAQLTRNQVEEDERFFGSNRGLA